MTEQTDSTVTMRAPQSGTYRPSRLMRLLLGVASNVQIGCLTIVLPDGTAHKFTGTEPGPAGTLYVHNDRMARRMILGGKLGFCESYLDGDWSSPDASALFIMTMLNYSALEKALDGRPVMRLLSRLVHLLKPNTRSGSRKNIAYHYDLGNEFYSRWLDPSMTYSSAVYADLAADEDMTTAQTRKYAELARRMDLRPEHHVLEIGCGWGGFAEYAAGTIGARVTAVTISQAQHDYAVARIAKAGLSDKVEIRLQDYRDVTGRFDRIASVEMFEAVGEKYWPQFFATLRDRLMDGGRAAMQIITIRDEFFDRYRRSADYIQRYIFPGGMLPSPTRLRDQVTLAGLEWQGSDSYGLHYARTLREWNVSFQAAWPHLVPLGFDERFKRMWEQYLWYCEAGFTTGSIDVVQVTVARP
ncbi:MAG: hypothetical protein RLY86_1292 [Pseudomonadota bacterium]|jgi:cyclopropane-fatty-acyl-phospholipid synthase